MLKITTIGCSISCSIVAMMLYIRATNSDSGISIFGRSFDISDYLVGFGLLFVFQVWVHFNAGIICILRKIRQKVSILHLIIIATLIKTICTPSLWSYLYDQNVGDIAIGFLIIHPIVMSLIVTISAKLNIVDFSR